MEELFDDPVARLILWTAAAGTLAAIAVYVLRKIRNEPAQQEPPASELLSKFREQHAKGEITDAEFRTIKTALADRLREELSDSGQTG
ncbi:MAG TPA: hypothetical protein EYP56_02630 [Planctomycetaceae bacterium]|nr:hypothetical protein [Planctomycetaceae bacterium]